MTFVYRPGRDEDMFSLGAVCPNTLRAACAALDKCVVAGGCVTTLGTLSVADAYRASCVQSLVLRQHELVRARRGGGSSNGVVWFHTSAGHLW